MADTPSTLETRRLKTALQETLAHLDSYIEHVYSDQPAKKREKLQEWDDVRALVAGEHDD